MKTIRLTAVAFALSSMFGAPAEAKTLTYLGEADGSTFSINLSDKPARGIRVKVGVTGYAADMLGFGFDWKGDVSTADFRFVKSSTGEDITGIFADAKKCGPGCHLPERFDSLLRLGQRGTKHGHILSFVFKIDTDESLTKHLFKDFGISARSSGADGDGSIKLVDFERQVPAPAPVPLPAAGLLLAAGLGGLGLLRRKRAG